VLARPRESIVVLRQRFSKRSTAFCLPSGVSHLGFRCVHMPSFVWRPNASQVQSKARVKSSTSVISSILRPSAVGLACCVVAGLASCDEAPSLPVMVE